MSQDAAIALEDSEQAAPNIAMAFAVLLVGHFTVDLLAAVMSPTLGLFRVRLGMTTEEAAWLLGVGPLASGMAQPICAFLSDLQHTRLWGLVGLALAGVGICSLGTAGGFYSLAAIYILGMIGVGMFHPVAATTAGYLRRHQRNSALSLFFVSGMIGGVVGSYFLASFSDLVGRISSASAAHGADSGFGGVHSALLLPIALSQDGLSVGRLRAGLERKLGDDRPALPVGLFSLRGERGAVLSLPPLGGGRVRCAALRLVAKTDRRCRSAGRLEIIQGDLCPDQSIIQLGLHVVQDAAPKMQPGKTVPFV